MGTADCGELLSGVISLVISVVQKKIICFKISIDFSLQTSIINIRWTNKTAEQVTLMRIGVMAAQQTLTLLVEVRVLYP